MIFVTVGNMDPFDRLIRAMDEWAGSHQFQGEIVAQIGRGTYHPSNFKWANFLTPSEYIESFERAELVVSHAGMGTIITALEKRKPLVIMPKLASLGEQRNEHQLATVRRFRRSEQILVADEEAALKITLDKLLNAETDGNLKGMSKISFSDWLPDASLIEFVRNFVSTGRKV